MPSFPNGLRLSLLLSCLLSSLIACDSQDKQKTKYFEEGKRLYKAGDYKKAQLAFDNALAIDPKNSQLRYELAEQLSGLGDIQDAAKQYQTVANQDAKHVMARVKLGQIYLLASKTDDASKMANEALAIDPENIDAMVLMGGILAAQNNSDAAFVKAETALQKKPDDIGATLLLASLTARTGKLDKATALLQAYAEKHPDNIASRLMLLNFYSQNNDSEKILATLEALVKIEPSVLEHRKRWAVFLINTKQLDKAESVLRTAVTELPDDVQAKLMLIDFLASQKTTEAAIAELIPMLEQNAGFHELRFKLADLQMAQKQSDKAEETLNEIVTLDKQGPSANKARNKIARLYWMTGRMEKANALIKALLLSNPSDMATLALRGEMALTESRPLDAITDFRTILAGQPQNIPVLKMLSAAHLANNNRLLARENMEKVVALAPNDEIARLDLVNLLLQNGDKDQASQQLNALFKLNPNSKKGLETLFKIFLSQKQWDQALQIASQYEHAYPDDATGFYLSGLALKASEKLEQSTPRFEQALERQAQAAEPLAQLVDNYLIAKQPDKALNLLQNQLKGQSGNFFAYNLTGDVYRHGNKYNEAVNAYQQALIIKPDWALPYRNIALTHILQKHKNEAIAILTQGINKAADPMELVTDLAGLYHQDGEHQKVIALYEDIHQKYPTSLTLLNNLVRYLTDYGNNADALSHAEKLAAPLAISNNPYMLDTVAWLAHKQGNDEKSLQQLAKVLELNPDLSVSLYHLGMVYFKQGDKTQAKMYLQKALDKKVDFNGLAEAKGTLELLEKTNE